MKRIILLIESSREFGRQMIIGIARYSRLNGPWSFYKEQIGLKSSIPKLTNWKPDGIIMRDSLIKDELISLKIPTILVQHDSSLSQDLPAVVTDSDLIAKMASEHLIEKGFKNYAYFGFDHFEWSNNRKQHFCKYNAEAGFETHVYNSPQIKEIIDWEKEQQHVCNWLERVPKPVGLMACNDDRAQNILDVCKRLSLRVPEDVAVIGVDNDPLVCETEDPPITSIAMNVETAGFEAAKLLDQMINNQNIESKQIHVSPTHIAQRQSSDILAVDDAEVASALQFIKENAKNKILIRDVVKATNVSRRTLEQKFKKSIHLSIYDKIRKIRVELITKLLLETDLPISHITSYFNFTDMEHISRYFKKEKGLGLREYRKLHQQR
jgi:LacI family transcriptional regulator